VERGASGELVSVDRRPVTFDKVESSRLRWGLNLSGAVAKAPEEAPDGGRGASRGDGGRGGMMGGGRGHGGRWNIALYHTLRFTDRVTISAGGPVLDQLDGEGLVVGGVPRHSLELEGGVFHKGFGIRLNGDWDSPARSSGLRFGSTFRLDARIFVNLGMQEKLVEKMPFLKGLRLAFDFDNIFDSRQKVTDANGVVPFAYSKDFRDPRGRFVGIDLRKMF
jgi:iron complex outermembrane recepter protein